MYTPRFSGSEYNYKEGCADAIAMSVAQEKLAKQGKACHSSCSATFTREEVGMAVIQKVPNAQLCTLFNIPDGPSCRI
jgi:hypothetical protein